MPITVTSEVIEVTVVDTPIQVTVATVGVQGIQGIQGVQGVQGIQGIPGSSGATWYTGAGAPAGGLGSDGDFYFRTDTGDVYTKAAGVWSVSADLTGPAGADGIDAVIETGPFTVLAAGNSDLLGELFDSLIYNEIDFEAQLVASTDVFAKKDFSIFFRNGAWELWEGETRYHEDSADPQVTFTVHPVTGQVNAANAGANDVEIVLKKYTWAA